jgi:hypothetical protein
MSPCLLLLNYKLYSYVISSNADLALTNTVQNFSWFIVLVSMAVKHNNVLLRLITECLYWLTTCFGQLHVFKIILLILDLPHHFILIIIGHNNHILNIVKLNVIPLRSIERLRCIV